MKPTPPSSLEPSYRSSRRSGAASRGLSARAPVAVVVGLALLATTRLLALTAPTPVSPTSEQGMARVEARCPTFSWTSVPNRDGYELVVYRVVGEVASDRLEVEAKPALFARVPGAANSYTPSLERCLEAGRLYAWSIRPLGSDDEAAAWSKPSRFEIVSRPSNEAVAEAVALLRRELQEGGAAGGTAAATPAGGVAAPAARPAVAARQAAPEGASTFEVDAAGNVVATSFAGDGSGLTSVAASTAAALAANPANCSAGSAPLGISASGAVESCFDVATQGELVSYLPSALSANGANCAAGQAPLGVSAAGAAEGCYDVATQAELNTHKTSTDHDARYLTLSGGTLNGPLFVTSINATNRVKTACGSGWSRAGSWCVENAPHSGTFSDAVDGCSFLGASLCSYGAMVTCDAVNLNSATVGSCGDYTDDPASTRIWLLSADGDSGDSTFDALTYNGDNTLSFTNGTESHWYYCCFPVNGVSF